MKQLIISATMLLCAVWGSVGSLEAGQIFKWKDSSGQVHFVDNLAKVPTEFRGDYDLDVNALEAAAAGKEKPAAARNEHWENMCIQCHFVGYGKNDKGQRGLSEALSYVDSNEAIEFEVFMPVLRDAVAGRFDMPKFDISEENLLLLGEFLLKEQDQYATKMW